MVWQLWLLLSRRHPRRAHRAHADARSSPRARSPWSPGLPLGVLLWRLETTRRILQPYLTTYYAIPIFAFYPLFIAIFGLGSMPVIIIAWAWAVVAIILQTVIGLDTVPEVLVKVGRSLNLSTLAPVHPHLLPGRDAAHLHRLQARRVLHRDRRDRERVHPGREGRRLLRRLLLQQLRDPEHVRGDPADPRVRGRAELGPARAGTDGCTGAAEQDSGPRRRRSPIPLAAARRVAAERRCSPATSTSPRPPTPSARSTATGSAAASARRCSPRSSAS